MMRIAPNRAAVSMKCAAAASGSTPRTRSSVDRSTRDTSEVQMIVAMKIEAIFRPFRPLGHVHECRVEKDRRNRPVAHDVVALLPFHDRHRHGARRDEHQHARRVRAALRFDVGVEGDRHDERDEREDDDERAVCARPFRRHAVAGKVSRHQVQQPGERGCAREPQHRDRRDVVDRAEQSFPDADARDTRGRVLPPGLPAQRLGGDQHGRHHAAGHQEHAHDERGDQQQLLGVSDAAERPIFGVVGSPLTSGITATPVSNPERPSASFGNTIIAAASIISGLPC